MLVYQFPQVTSYKSVVNSLAWPLLFVLFFKNLISFLIFMIARFRDEE